MIYIAMGNAQTQYEITKRAKADLTNRGYIVASVERWVPFACVRQDLFGFADLLAFSPSQPEILLVQTTTKGNMSARKRKIEANEIAPLWLNAGHKIEIQGWHKEGNRWKADYIHL